MEEFQKKKNLEHFSLYAKISHIFHFVWLNNSPICHIQYMTNRTIVKSTAIFIPKITMELHHGVFFR